MGVAGGRCAEVAGRGERLARTGDVAGLVGRNSQSEANDVPVFQGLVWVVEYSLTQSG